MLRKILLGVFVLLLLGVFAALLFFKPFASKTIRGAIRDYALTQCPSCKVEIGEVSLEVAALKLGIASLKISKPNETSIALAHASAAVSLRNIFRRQIEITRVSVSGLAIVGTTEGSVLLDLATPHKETAQQEERKEASSFSVVLRTLDAENLSVSQRLDSQQLLSASGIRIELHGNDRAEYTITPSISQITLRDAEGEEITLGEVRARLEVSEKQTSLDNFEWLLKDSWIRAKALLRDQQLSGSISHRIATRSFEFESPLEAIIVGETQVSGSRSSPLLAGRLAQESTESLRIQLNNEQPPLCELTSLDAAYSFSLVDGNPQARLTQLDALGPTISARVVSPLSLTDQQLGGDVFLEISSFAYQDSLLENLELQLNFAGQLSDPQIKAAGTIGTFSHKKFQLNSVAYLAALHGDKIDIEVSHPQGVITSSPLTNSIHAVAAKY